MEVVDDLFLVMEEHSEEALEQSRANCQVDVMQGILVEEFVEQVFVAWSLMEMRYYMLFTSSKNTIEEISSCIEENENNITLRFIGENY